MESGKTRQIQLLYHLFGGTIHHELLLSTDTEKRRSGVSGNWNQKEHQVIKSTVSDTETRHTDFLHSDRD